MNSYSIPRVIIFYFIFLGVSKVQAQNGDCALAFPICQLKNYYFSRIDGYGQLQETNKLSIKKCNIIETNSVWLNWEIAKDGILDFVIIPNNYTDDFDFILFRSKDLACHHLEAKRIMLSGNNFDDEISECAGATGSSSESKNLVRLPGCKTNTDSFVKSIFAKEGDKFFLWINNYDSTEGFNIFFEGDARFTLNEDCRQESPSFNLSVYPNPAADYLIVDFEKELIRGYHYEVFNLNGQLVHNGTLKNPNSTTSFYLNLNSLKPANYFIRISNSAYSQLARFTKL